MSGVAAREKVASMQRGEARLRPNWGASGACRPKAGGRAGGRCIQDRLTRGPDVDLDAQRLCRRLELLHLPLARRRVAAQHRVVPKGAADERRGARVGQQHELLDQAVGLLLHVRRRRDGAPRGIQREVEPRVVEAQRAVGEAARAQALRDPVEREAVGDDLGCSFCCVVARFVALLCVPVCCCAWPQREAASREEPGSSITARDALPPEPRPAPPPQPQPRRTSSHAAPACSATPQRAGSNAPSIICCTIG